MSIGAHAIDDYIATGTRKFYQTTYYIECAMNHRAHKSHGMSLSEDGNNGKHIRVTTSASDGIMSSWMVCNRGAIIIRCIMQITERDPMHSKLLSSDGVVR